MEPPIYNISSCKSVVCKCFSVVSRPICGCGTFAFTIFLTCYQKPKRRTPTYSGRSTVQDKSQRSRSMSFSPERVRVRGRSPAFTALAANFESANSRNLSTPPPVVKKLYPKSATPDSSSAPSKSSATASLTGSFDRPKSVKGM